MVIKEKLGNLREIAVAGTAIDTVLLEWYETTKRIQHKRSLKGHELTFKFLKDNPALTPGDIIYREGNNIIVVDVLPCEVIVICVSSMYEMACVCYEIGNKHVPLFFENEQLLVPFEAPLYRLLSNAGYKVEKDQRKLIHPLKTSVLPHAHSSGSRSLFSLIMDRTTSLND